ncbi:uncharacterized protein ATC70_013300 [Mucor velutinosus]|uniref:Uncharacterized protein n=1 Tax=Mucor velutinosus TaxID=708070 RepID=A0AAN7D729_9FUNG|nr:hypothetical protein ATC70_013300 [Mucor velutinosus]
MNLAIAPTKTVSSIIPSQHIKRQVQATSVVHITITAAGTVVYTQTATSYSYVASYSPVTGSDPAAYPTNNDTNNDNNSSSNPSGAGGGPQTGHTEAGVNTGAIIGGVVGGVAFIALIGLGYFLMRRSQKRKRERQKNDLIDDDDDSYYRGHQRHPSTAMDGAGATNMTSLSPAPRHLVAPLNHLGEREGDGRESKYYPDGGGYYDDIVATTPYPHQAFYSGNNSVAASDSLPSTTVEPYSVGSAGFRQVPNEVDYPAPAMTGERHVPHLKDDVTTTIEPPHTKD